MTEKRWDRLAVKDICADANVTRGTFYQYFDDIYDLMERIQSRLLEDLQVRYKKVCTPRHHGEGANADGTDCRFSEETPEIFEVWFAFCRDHRDAMLALTDEDRGDPYFRKKLWDIMMVRLDQMMDWDGMPRDALRRHFHELFFAMHYHTMAIWLSGDSNVPAKKMAQVLNSMRLGATYIFMKETGRVPKDKTEK